MTDYLKTINKDYKGFAISQVLGKDGHAFDLFIAKNAEGVSVRGYNERTTKDAVDSYLLEHANVG